MPKEEITGWTISERTDPQDLEKQLDDLSYMQQWGFTGTRCNTCGTSNSELGGTLMQCAKCNQVQYCNWACLKKNEAKHLPECEKFCNARRRQRQQAAAANNNNNQNGTPTPIAAQLSETTTKSKGTHLSLKTPVHGQGGATTSHNLKKPFENSSSARTITTKKDNTVQPPSLPSRFSETATAGDAKQKNKISVNNTTAKQHALHVHPLDSVVERNKTHSNNAKPPGRRSVEPKEDDQCNLQSSLSSTSRSTGTSNASNTTGQATNTNPSPMQQRNADAQQERMSISPKRLDAGSRPPFQPPTEKKTSAAAAKNGQDASQSEDGPVTRGGVVQSATATAVCSSSSIHPQQQQQQQQQQQELSTLDTAVQPPVNGHHNSNKNTPETVPKLSKHEHRRTAKKTGAQPLRSLSTPPVDRTAGARTEQSRTLPNRLAVGSNRSESLSSTRARHKEKVGDAGEGLIKAKKGALVLANRKWPPQTADDEREYVIHHPSDLAKSTFSSSRNWTPKKAATPKLNGTTTSPKTLVQTTVVERDEKSAESQPANSTRQKKELNTVGQKTLSGSSHMEPPAMQTVNGAMSPKAPVQTSAVERETKSAESQPANSTRQKKEQPQTIGQKSLSGSNHMEPPGHVLENSKESHNLTLAKSASISTGPGVSQEQNQVGQKEPPGYLLEQVDSTAAPAKPPLVAPINNTSLKTTEAPVSTEQANVVNPSPKLTIPEQLSNKNGSKEHASQNSKEESELQSASQPGPALSDSAEEIPAWMQKTPVQTVARVDSKEPPMKTSLSFDHVESTPVRLASENSGMTSDSTVSSSTVNALKGTTLDGNIGVPLVEVVQEEPPAFNPYRSYKAPMKKDDDYTVSRNNSLNGRRRPRRNKSYS